MIINKKQLFELFSNNRVIDFTNKNGETAHLLVVDACPDKGFNFGYILYLPNEIRDYAPIFVKCANTGKTKESLEEGLKDVFDSSIDFGYSSDLAARGQNLTILRPLIPRFFIGGENLYSHNFSSDVYFTKNELFKGLDIQMINMIRDAKQRLELLGLNIDEKIIIEGFSASGVFANRFTVLHPELVKLCIAGGFNGKLTLPLKEYKGKELIYPIGVSNIPYYSDAHLEEFKKVRQFYYMGSLDTNDSLATIEKDGILYPKYKDVCTKEELDLFFSIFGREPKNRFFRSKEIYRDIGVNTEFKIYEGFAHTDVPALNDMKVEMENILLDSNRKL